MVKITLEKRVLFIFNFIFYLDHLSQILEIVGDVSIQNLKIGKKFKDYFNSRGTLRHIFQPSQWYYFTLCDN